MLSVVTCIVTMARAQNFKALLFISTALNEGMNIVKRENIFMVEREREEIFGWCEVVLHGVSSQASA